MPYEYTTLDELPDPYDVVEFYQNSQDTANLGILKLNDDQVAVDWLNVQLTVFDAMKLREGLDTFISQAVGADV